ncbi:MAG TPA: hypothetical protein VE864_03125 [Streptosporangiaceae bacterium]|nr:hypothetical protein [Streptosporangiaceae bacterium]
MFPFLLRVSRTCAPKGHAVAKMTAMHATHKTSPAARKAFVSA